MTVICWGALGKAAGDDTTIDQEINTYITRHDENPNAHMGEDYALGVHRLQAVLDHVDGSIELKKLSRDKIIKFTDWVSFDGFDTGGSYVHPGFMGATVRATGGGGSAYVREEADDPAAYLNFSKNPFFQVSVRLGYNTSQTFYLLLGAEPSEGADDSFGFKVVNGSLYAYWTKAGSQYTQVIAGVDVTELNVYRAYCDSTNSKIYFYVNGTLAYTATANYPTDTNGFVLYFYLTADGANNRHFELYDLLWMQDR
jgi:hypothetical protein